MFGKTEEAFGDVIASIISSGGSETTSAIIFER